MTQSEAWTREVLAELRSAHFTLPAWRRFLARSLQQAGEQRGERRPEHRKVVVLAALGVAGWSFAAVEGRPVLAAAGATWWLLVSLMLDWHLGMLERPDGTRLDGIGPANLITILRGGLPPALFALAGTAAGVVMLAAAGAADVVDGRLARRRQETSRLGLWLDGSVDTTVTGAAALGAVLHGLLPVWAVALVLLRLALPWAVGAAAYFGRAERPARDGFATGRALSLVAGAVLFTGLVLAFLRLPGAASLVGLGAAAGLGAFALAIQRTRSGEGAAAR